jgi:hypothetical protein
MIEFTTGGHLVYDLPECRRRDYAFASCDVAGRRYWLLVAQDGTEAFACSTAEPGTSPHAVPEALLDPAYTVRHLEEVSPHGGC